MGHKTLIGGTSYKVAAGRTMVEGTVRGIVSGRTMVEGTVHSLPLLSSVFADNDWEDIIEACETRRVPDTWEIGDSKPAGSYEIVIIGKNHDTYSDGGGTAPLTFQFKNSAGSYRMDDSSFYSWSGCYARNTAMPAILALLPSVIQAGVKNVDKVTQYGTVNKYLETTRDKLFLLSEVEVTGATTNSTDGEGSLYEYYAAEANRKKGFVWPLRSRYRTQDAHCCSVNMAGTIIAMGTTGSAAMLPAFCF